MRVLVTGGSGSVGSRLVGRLVRSGQWDVRLLLRDPAKAWRIQDVLPKVRVLRGDLASPDSYGPELAAFAPEAVVHLGWQGVLNRERNEPAQATNVVATMELLRRAIQSGVRHFVGLGSQAEYGPCPARIPESTPTCPTTLYGVAKLSASLFSQAQCQQAGVRFAWLRLFSSYGPGDDPAWLIPYLCKTFLRGESPAMTPAEQLWDYLYVEDAAEAVERVLATPEAAGFFNLGSGRPVPVRAIAERVRDLIDPKLEIGFGRVAYRPDQVMHMEADIGRLVAATGWCPATSLEQGLEETVAWFREHRGDA